MKPIILPVLSMMFIGSALPSLAADNPTRSRFLTLSMNDGVRRDFLITDDLKLAPIDSSTLHISSSLYDDRADLDNLKALGITWMAQTGIDSLTTDQSSADSWTITDMSGRLIGAGKEGQPDFSILTPGNIYIVKENTTYYKYIRVN